MLAHAGTQGMWVRGRLGDLGLPQFQPGSVPDEQGRVREREGRGERESQAGFPLTVEPDMGLDLRTITLLEIKSWTLSQLGLSGAPRGGLKTPDFCVLS